MASFSSNLSESTFPDLHPEKWEHAPVFVKAGNGTKVNNNTNNDKPLPLGVPFEFESSLFKGKILLRFRNVKSDDESSHSTYFDGRKRLMQTILQGRFKRNVKMSELYVGSMFTKPLLGVPPPMLTSIMDAVIRRIAPGLILDLTSRQPKVIALLGGSAQSMDISIPGKEPDIMARDIVENVVDVLGSDIYDKVQRRKRLGDPSIASTYEYDTDHVYTFESYDDAMDYGHGTMHIPMYGEYDIKEQIGRQPLSLTAVTESGEVLYDLRVWHQSHYQEEEEDNDGDADGEEKKEEE